MSSTRSSEQLDSMRVGVVRPEHRLLLLCSRTSIPPIGVSEIEALVRSGIDWSYLTNEAIRLGVLPLFARTILSTCPQLIPHRSLDQLRHYYLGNAQHNLQLTAELLSIINQFSARNIQALPLKGPVLAVLAYGDTGLRQFSDLDILVHRQNVAKAKMLLIERGYELMDDIPTSQEVLHLETQLHYTFVHPETDVVVELHFAIHRKYFGIAFEPEDVWERTQQVQLANQAVLCLSPEDLFLTLTAHGAIHRWERLSWITDIAELMRLYREIEWDTVLERARGIGSERMTLLGLALAHYLSGAPAPPMITERLRNDRVIPFLVMQVHKRLFEQHSDQENMLHVIAFAVNVRPQLRDKLLFILRLSFTPNQSEWALISLPPFLSGIYYVIRLVRIAGSYSRAWYKSLTSPSSS